MSTNVNCQMPECHKCQKHVNCQMSNVKHVKHVKCHMSTVKNVKNVKKYQMSNVKCQKCQKCQMYHVNCQQNQTCQMSNVVAFVAKPAVLQNQLCCKPASAARRRGHAYQCLSCRAWCWL